MRVKVTDTQGIKDHTRTALLATKPARLALSKVAGPKATGASMGASAWAGRHKTAAPSDRRAGFDRLDLIRAIFQELRLLQNQGAQFVFEARYPSDFSRTSAKSAAPLNPTAAERPSDRQSDAGNGSRQETDHFSLLKLADFLILGQGGKTLLLKINQKKTGQAFRSSWHTRLMTLGHAIAYLECETPLDGREQLRKLMHRQGYLVDAPQSAFKASAKAQAQALFS